MQRIKFYGIGGQGVVTAAKTLSIAVSIHEDEYAITVPAYGHERRGAPVYTDMVIDKKPIVLNCFVYEPDIVVVLDEFIIDQHKHVNVAKGKHAGTVLVINTAKIETAKRYAETYGFKKTYYVDATKCALDNIGRGIPNGAMLGALARTGAVKIESVEKALREVFGKAGEKNANAARAAYEQSQEL